MSIFIHHGSSCLELIHSPTAGEEPTDAEIKKGIAHLISAEPRSPQPLLSSNVQSLMERIIRSFLFMEAAGGVVQDLNNRYLLIHRRGHWDLPKGKIDPGEKPLTTAKREIEEETGLKDLVMTRSLPATFHIYEWEGKWILKKTHWFLFGMEKEQSLILQKEEDIEEGRWMQNNEVKQHWEEIYPSLRPLLRTVMS